MSLVNGQYSTPFPVVQKLSDTGFENPGAITNFNGNYSDTPQDIFFTAPPGLIVELTALNIAITATGSFLPDEYGSISLLPNGILTILELDGFQITNPEQTLNSNSELFGVDSAAQIIEYGNNRRTLVARFTYSAPVILNGDTQDKFICRLQDNFSLLEAHEFTAYGRI